MRLMDAAHTDAIFKALADPTRRTLLSLLAREGQSVMQLTSHFDMSQPAVSQHLRVLRLADLVVERRSGRNRIYELNPDPLFEAREWLDENVRFWASRLDRLGEHLRKKNA